MPTAEIISIGDELTSGQRLDTNSQWLSQQLSDIGVRALFHTTVADDDVAMRQAMDIARRRVQILLVTGGLGPTADDLTRQAIADVAGVDMETDEATVDYIRRLFQSRGRDMPNNNRVQAMYPVGGSLIPNKTGTAPGIDFHFHDEENDCRLLAFPGVPAELKPMWHDYGRPAVLQHLPQLGIIVHRAIHCFGLAESDVEGRLPEMIKRGRIPSVGITATKATITLRISAAGKTIDECEALIDPTAQSIHDSLGDFIFGENEITLQEVVVAELDRLGKSFAVVDLGSCSLIADWLHEADPTGDVYRGTLSLAGTADKDIQRSLVVTAQETFGTEFVLLIGPTFEHSGLLKRDVAIYHGGDEIKTRFGASSNPAIMVQRSVKQALNFMRLALQRGKF